MLNKKTLTSVFETLKMSLSAILDHRLRSSLTLLGVIIGVTSVITIISAIEALMGSIEAQTRELGPATFLVTKFGMITSREDYFKAIRRKNLTLHDIRALQKGCQDCVAVGALTDGQTTVKRGNKGLRNVHISGATANIIDILDFQVAEGRSFSGSEHDRKRFVAFVGPTIAEELFEGKSPIGQEIKVRNRKFYIIGMAKKRGSLLGQDQDNFVMIPLSTHIKIFGPPRFNLQLAIKSATIKGINDTQDQVRAILRARRGVPYDDEDDFDMLTAENIMMFVENVTKGARIALIAISSIAIVVGGIVIMNIMMVSVTERTREIGIRKSIGAQRKYIMLQFLFEALILSLGGGIIGITLGIGLAIILGSQIALPVAPSLLAITAGLSISMGVGVFFGLYPAIKASQLNPIDALRYE
ncbi:ABC transporter permease [candidate division CSSED10-310 bacterium]|uniref:ABC transporter permease n=1 Tax=candidate division CSSED10-310 bacterium TaxID=2855610 RepID=A0ABV6Z4D8_UNCC1